MPYRVLQFGLPQSYTLSTLVYRDKSLDGLPNSIMSPSRISPTQFLPPLPPQSRNTLSPLVRERLSECITSLRGMIVSPVLISGDVVNESPARSTQLLNGEKATDSAETLDEGGEEDDEFFLDEFERSWAERWLNGVITRGEGWLAEVEPEEEDVSGNDSSPAEGNGVEEENFPEWEEYLAREQVLQEASELLSLMVCCTGKHLHLPVNISPVTHLPLTSFQAQAPSCGKLPSQRPSPLQPPVARFHLLRKHGVVEVPC
jgi:hypothetical protein